MNASKFSPVLHQWSSFAEARVAMDVMSLEELEETSNVNKPKLLAFATITLGIGVILVLIGFRQVWLLPFGLLFIAYSLVVLGINRTRITRYREQCYRDYVHRRAAEIQAEDD